MKFLGNTNKRRFIISRKSPGGALLFTVIVTLVIMLIAIPFLSVILLELGIAGNQQKRIVALYLADAGIEYGNYQLSVSGGTWSGTEVPVYLTCGTQTIGSFRVSVSRRLNAYNQWIYTLISVGTPLGSYSLASVICKTRQSAFLDELFCYNHTRNAGGSEVWWFSGDTARGPVHTNDYLNVTGTPTFMRYVTTRYSVRSSAWYAPPAPRFMEGVQTGVPVKELPSTVDMAELRNLAQSGGWYINPTGTATVTLNSNGTMRIQWRAGSNNYDSTYNIADRNGVLYINSDVNVSGTLNGRLHIVANGSIYITNNLIYADRSVSSDDILGLTANNNVEIPSSAPSNITIDAVIVARTGEFRADTSVLKSTLTFTGAVVEHFLGAFARANASGQVTGGYRVQNWFYDNRLGFMAPPHFFRSRLNQFQMIYWKNAYFL